MKKYRGTYRVFLQKDKNGNYTENEFDTYLKCRANTQIYRYNDNTLAILFTSTGYKNNRLKDFESIGVKVTNLVLGDSESVYLMSEDDIDKVAEILKPIVQGAGKSLKTGIRKGTKREMTEEQKIQLRERLMLGRQKSMEKKSNIGV